MALYQARGVRRDMTIRQDSQVTHFVMLYNEQNKLRALNSTGAQNRQMDFIYDQLNHPTEIKTVSSKDVTRTVMTYTQTGKPLKTSSFVNEKPMLVMLYGYDAQDRATSLKMQDGKRAPGVAIRDNLRCRRKSEHTHYDIQAGRHPDRYEQRQAKKQVRAVSEKRASSTR